MTNTTNHILSPAAMSGLVAIDPAGSQISRTAFATKPEALAELVALGWVEVVNLGPGAGDHVFWTSTGSEAVDAAMAAAAAAPISGSAIAAAVALKVRAARQSL